MEGAGNRDIVVIGASAGGVEALLALVQELPRDLPAALLIVQHLAEDSPGVMAQLLSRRGALPAVNARDGMEPRPGHIYLAPPNRHLLLATSGMRVVYGPRENRTRPAIDPLFRTAAVNYRSRVIGLIMTGLLGDGAAGLLAVSRCGGVPLVQAPDDAAFPDMPRQALSSVASARQVPLAELAAVLDRLTHETAPEPTPVPETLRLEAQLTERAMTTEDWNEMPGRSTDFTCPECNGAIREIEDEEGELRYRCRVGHGYSLEALVAAKDQAVEDALWLALQTLQERAQMLQAMAREDQSRGRARSAIGLQERAREAGAHAQKLRDLIARLSA